jgi:MFS family permease
MSQPTPQTERSTSGESHDPYAALRHRNFRLYLATSLLATIGAEMQTVAVGWELYERTGSAMALGLVGLVQVIPVVLLALPAGHVADRFRRKDIVMGAQAVMMLASIGLACVSHLRGPLIFVYASLFMAGVAGAFSFPARWAFMPELVPAEDFHNAVTWRSSGWQISAVVGPALGGLGIAAWRSAGPVYAIDATCSLVVLAMFTLISGRPRPKPLGQESFNWSTLLAGIRFVRQSELILAAITLDMFAVLLGGATTLLPIYAKDILHVGPTGLGWLRAAPSVGALCMAMLIAHRPPMRRAGRALLTAVSGFGIATIVFGFSRDYRLSLLMLFLTGAFDNVSVVIRATLVQVLTPDVMRGRVSAVNSVFIGMSNELGGFESGLAARLFGPVIAVVAGGVGCLLVVLGVVLAWPRILGLGSLQELALGMEQRPDELPIPQTPLEVEGHR